MPCFPTLGTSRILSREIRTSLSSNAVTRNSVSFPLNKYVNIHWHKPL